MEELCELGDYQLWVNKDSTDRKVLYPVLVGDGYTRYIDPQADDVWMDAGAHVGAFSIRHAHQVSKIYAYEPNERNFELLQMNLKCYPQPNVDIVKAALVGNDDTSRQFWHSTGKDRTCSSVIQLQRRESYYQVDCLNVVEEIRRHNINCVKMDIEGAELECLMSLPVTVMRSLRELIFEYHFTTLRDVGVGDKYFQLIDHLAQGFIELDYLEDIGKQWNCTVYARNY